MRRKLKIWLWKWTTRMRKITKYFRWGRLLVRLLWTVLIRCQKCTSYWLKSRTRSCSWVWEAAVFWRSGSDKIRTAATLQFKSLRWFSLSLILCRFNSKICRSVRLLVPFRTMLVTCLVWDKGFLTKPLTYFNDGNYLSTISATSTTRRAFMKSSSGNLSANSKFWLTWDLKSSDTMLRSRVK